MPNTTLTGFEPLTNEFTPAHHSLAADGVGAWQKQATANIIVSILENVYGCSNNPCITFWSKSPTKIIIKIGIPFEYPNILNQASRDRLSVEKFVGDVRNLKSDTDEIYFLKDGTPSNPPLMSFDIPAILPYLKKIAENTDPKHRILTAIDQISSSYEKAKNHSIPKYNN